VRADRFRAVKTLIWPVPVKQGEGFSRVDRADGIRPLRVD